MKYVANDGKIFDYEDECLDYERSFEKKKYNEKFVDPPLKARADYVIKRYFDYARKKSLSDDFIEECNRIEDGNEPTRHGDATLCCNVSYGICYLRDDAVDILIDYIFNLENEVQRLNNKLEAN